MKVMASREYTTEDGVDIKVEVVDVREGDFNPFGLNILVLADDAYFQSTVNFHIIHPSDLKRLGKAISDLGNEVEKIGKEKKIEFA